MSGMDTAGLTLLRVELLALLLHEIPTIRMGRYHAK